tara:strand:- start:811 stop:1101 length:291 start_codon:yes stop_codon:yes gene_type:complete
MNLFNCDHIDKKYNELDIITIIVYAILSFVAGGIVGFIITIFVNLLNSDTPTEASMAEQLGAIVPSFGFLGLMIYIGLFFYQYKKCTGVYPGKDNN